MKKFFRRAKASVGIKLCDFGLWLLWKTEHWAQEVDELAKDKHDFHEFEKLKRDFRIQASELRLVREKNKKDVG